MALTAEATRFLVCGGLAAFVNWAARIALSLALPFEAAVILAYLIGMTAGFLLYRGIVWRERAGSLRDQLLGFVAVNAASAVVVFGASLALRKGLVLAGLPLSLAEALAHGAAIGIGAIANFVGHRSITFRRRAGA